MKGLLLEKMEEQLNQGKSLWLFLDYDGTLADFAPTPEDVIPDEQVIKILSSLARSPEVHLAVISGRRLAHIRKLVPVPGVILAGTYGIELYVPGEGEVQRLDMGLIRPVLDRVKPLWEELIARREGFFLEDKGWSLALHARFAGEDEAQGVLSKARKMVSEDSLPDTFRLLGGNKFLEVGPDSANKGETVSYLLEYFQYPETTPVFLGDDDKDEEAFEVVKNHGGIAVVVGRPKSTSTADYHLDSPEEVRAFLGSLAQILP